MSAVCVTKEARAYVASRKTYREGRSEDGWESCERDEDCDCVA